MDQKAQIRHMVLAEGKSRRQVECETEHSRNTIKKMPTNAEVPRYEKKADRVAPILGPYKELINARNQQTTHAHTLLPPFCWFSNILDTLTGVIERITYHNEENGYTVAKLTGARGGKLVTIVGNMLGVSVGESVQLRGAWANHPKFGRQFKFTSPTLSVHPSLSSPWTMFLQSNRRLVFPLLLPSVVIVKKR